MLTSWISSFVRLRAGHDQSGRHRREIVLAVTRLILAANLAILAYLRALAGRPASVAVPVLPVSYVAYALLILILAWARPRHSFAFRMGTQVVDVVWPLFIPWLVANPTSLIAAFQLYAVLAAACRWAVWQTLVTAGAAATVFVFQARVANSGHFLGTFPEPVVVSGMICLVTVAGLVAYLGHDEQSPWANCVRTKEQARLARELHDGVVQTLIATDMRIEVLRREAGRSFPDAADELVELQGFLRQEIVNVRQLIQQLSASTLDPERLFDELARITGKFQRETGIEVSFLSNPEKVMLTPPTCNELVRIVQEALANVMKHGAARRVLVRLAPEAKWLKLLIEDDGRGFEFAGRLSQADLEATSQGPKVIQERVRSVGGQLAIESVPGHCARLEISLPCNVHG